MAAYGQLGFPGEVDIEIGENSSFPHGSIVPQTIREGSLIMLDDGCTVEGYQSDITRTFVFGKPSDKMKQVFEIVHRAQTAALEGGPSRSGVPGRGCGGAKSDHAMQDTVQTTNSSPTAWDTESEWMATNGLISCAATPRRWPAA